MKKCYKLNGTYYYTKAGADQALAKYLSRIARLKSKYKERWLYRAFMNLLGRRGELGGAGDSFYLEAIVDMLDSGISSQYHQEVCRRLYALEEVGIVQYAGCYPSTEDEFGRFIDTGAKIPRPHWRLYLPTDVWPAR